MDQFKLKTDDKVQTLEGIHRITLFDMATKKARDIQNKILELSKRPLENRKEYQYWHAQLLQLCAERQLIMKNLVVLAGRAVIAQRLGGVTTYTGTIDDGAVGTSSTSPAAGNTQLGAEVYRKEAASYDNTQNSSGITVISFFYSENDFTNANINEFGTFIDGGGTGNPNTGQMLSHLKFPETINKTALKSLSIDAQYTIL